jgi:hypothetical protein
MQSTIEAMSGYSAKWGASNATIYFDLPSTVNLLGTNNYTYGRNPKFDTATALGWYDLNSTRATPYYTSGTSDPAVGDTIYSDSTCTTPVTTINSIIV